MKIKLLKNLTIEDEILTIEQAASTATRISQLDMLSKIYITLNYVDYDLPQFKVGAEDEIDMVKTYEFINEHIWKQTSRKLGKKKIKQLKTVIKERYLEINNPIKNLVLSEEDIKTIEKLGKQNA